MKLSACGARRNFEAWLAEMRLTRRGRPAIARPERESPVGWFPPGGRLSLQAPKDPWEHLAGLTPARVALGRAGCGLPTRELLRFEQAHAQARDAVGATLDATSLHGELAASGLPVLQVASHATDRTTYLQRPDLGRRLDEAGARQLAATGGEADLALVIADGLSALAVLRYGAPTVMALLPLLEGLRIAPLVIATQGPVWLWPTKWGPCLARGWR